LKAGVHPRFWLSGSTLAFGAVMIGFGWAPTWGALAGLRIPLGFFEGAPTPLRVITVELTRTLQVSSSLVRRLSRQVSLPCS
jgi:hypothetical protein